MKHFKSNYWGWLIPLVLCLMGGGLVSVWLKQDANWDLMNYHIYNPWALLHDRADIDLFAAGIQSYFNPLLDLPYYYFAFVWFSDQPRTVAFLMGIPYGLLVFLTLHSARLVLADLQIAPRAQLPLALLLVAFGVTGAATFPQVGTTFNEPQVAALILAGVAVLLSGLPARPAPLPPVTEGNPCGTGEGSFSCWALWGGILFGLAAGLKLTASIYAPAAVLALLVAAKSRRRAVATAAVFSLGWALGFGIAFGWWAFHLYSTMGNPMFPMFENVFHTHWLGTENWMENRFKPQSLLQALIYPLYWIDTASVTIAEPVFSDPRFSITLIVFTVLTIALVHSHAGAWFGRTGIVKPPWIPRTSRFVLAFTASSYVIWLSFFSILRYAVSIEVLLGLVIGICLILYPRFFGSAISETALIIISFLLLVFVSIQTRYPEWGRAEYSDAVLKVQPVKLAPDSLVIVLGSPQAYVLPSLVHQNPGAQFVGIGNFPLNARKFDLWKKVRQKIDIFPGTIYAMTRLDAQQLFGLLPELNLHLDEESCRIFSTNIDPGFNICRLSRPGH